METYTVNLEPAEPDRFAATIPALPGVLVLGRSIDEVLERAQAAIDFHIGQDGRGRKRQIAVALRARLTEAA